MLSLCSKAYHRARTVLIVLLVLLILLLVLALVLGLVFGLRPKVIVINNSTNTSDILASILNLEPGITRLEVDDSFYFGDFEVIKSARSYDINCENLDISFAGFVTEVSYDTNRKSL